MGFLKNLFTKKSKEEKIKEEIEEKKENLPNPEDDYSLCEKCGMELKPEHFIVTMDKKKFHKQCMRQIRREARRKAFSN